MEWPFPIAETARSLQTSNRQMNLAVDGFACSDRTFARHFEKDVYLREVYSGLLSNNDVPPHEEKSPPLKSAKYSILRGLLTRADFATEQKIVFLAKWQSAVEDDDQNQLLCDADGIEKEVRRTLSVLKKFQKSFSPSLDTSIETLESLSHVSLNRLVAHPCSQENTDEETEPGSDNEIE